MTIKQAFADQEPFAKLTSLDDIRHLLANLPGPDDSASARAKTRADNLTKPQGSLGRLEEMSSWLCRWQGTHPPRMDHPQACVFAGNHGFVRHAVSTFPPEVTTQMVANFNAGGAAINQLCNTMGAEITVRALDLERPTQDFTEASAMDDADCAAAMRLGMAAVNPAADLVCPGEMGIGNTTAASALCQALLGGEAEDWTGPGTGVRDAALTRKITVVRDGVSLHSPHINDGLDALCRLGGREIAAMAGAILGARLLRIPVMLDGFICTAAALTLQATLPGALDHCMVAHASAEPAHRILVDRLGKIPIFDIGLRLGEGTGGVLAIGFLKGAVACHTGMVTFAEAGVSESTG